MITINKIKFRVYDSGNSVIDRYTVCPQGKNYVDHYKDGKPMYFCLGMDNHGGRSFSQFSTYQKTRGNKHLGKELKNIDKVTRKHITQRFFNNF